MAEFHVREAQAGDGPGIACAWVDAGVHHAALDPEHHQVPGRDGLDRWCEDAIAAAAERGGLMLVAEGGGRILGFANVVLREPRNDAAQQIQRDQGMRRAWLGAIVVLASERERGIGRSLLRAAERWARHHGAESIQLDVLPSNAAALGLYRREGFSEIALLLEKRL